MLELERNPVYRYLVMAILVVAILLSFQYARDWYAFLYYKIQLFYNWGISLKLIQLLDKVIPLDLSTPLPFTKLVASIQHLLCMLYLTHLWFLDGRITKMAARIIGGWFALGILLILLTRILNDPGLLLHARTLNDYLLQPFGVSFLIPVLYLYRAQLPKSEQVEGARKTKKPRPNSLDADIVVVDD